VSDPDLTCPRCGVVKPNKVLSDFHRQHCRVVKADAQQVSEGLSADKLAQVDEQIEVRWSNFVRPPGKEK
jgi:hypothetical protein